MVNRVTQLYDGRMDMRLDEWQTCILRESRLYVHGAVALMRRQGFDAGTELHGILLRISRQVDEGTIHLHREDEVHQPAVVAGCESDMLHLGTTHQHSGHARFEIPEMMRLVNDTLHHRIVGNHKRQFKHRL